MVHYFLLPRMESQQPNRMRVCAEPCHERSWILPFICNETLVACRERSIEAHGKLSLLTSHTSVCERVCECVSAYDCCSRSLSSGINSLLSAVLLQMAPTIFELALVCSVLVCSRVRSRFSTSTLTDCAANRHTTAAPTTLPSPSPPSEHTPPSRWLSRNGGANQLHSTRQSQSALSV